ncbi:MAG: hypothetical protein HY721_23640 [Planctomycetes bacterium]|nr:hypothetical protein [Planctomycetota bacterium]
MDKLLIGFTALRPGQLPASHDVTLSVAPGEGQALLDPNEPPTLGTITRGRLVIASESFPRFAPLTFTLTGADLCFTVRRRRLLSFAVRDRDEDFLRLHCSSLWKAAYLHRLFLPFKKRVVVTRVNLAAGGCGAASLDFGPPDVECRSALQIDVLQGEIGVSPDFAKGLKGLVQDGKVELRRDAQGELKLQMHGARMEWELARGVLVGLRVHDSRGTVANLSVLDHSGAGVGTTVSVLDTLA